MAVGIGLRCGAMRSLVDLVKVFCNGRLAQRRLNSTMLPNRVPAGTDVSFCPLQALVSAAGVLEFPLAKEIPESTCGYSCCLVMQTYSPIANIQHI
ncbi:hypothetical protein LEMLEM_LOCUS7835 [Lemmus lemmus]